MHWMNAFNCQNLNIMEKKCLWSAYGVTKVDRVWKEAKRRKYRRIGRTPEATEWGAVGGWGDGTHLINPAIILFDRNVTESPKFRSSSFSGIVCWSCEATSSYFHPVECQNGQKSTPCPLAWSLIIYYFIRAFLIFAHSSYNNSMLVSVQLEECVQL